MMYSVRDILLTILVLVIVTLGIAWQWEKVENESLLLENVKVKVEAKVDQKSAENADLSDDMKQLKAERMNQLKKIQRGDDEELNLSIGVHTTIFGD